MKFFNELKRRNVIKATIAYIVVAWVLLQVLSTILPAVEAPTWVFKTLMIFMVIGFPIWVIFSWVYEVTPEGLKKTAQVSDDNSITATTNKRLNIIIIITLIVAIAVSFFNKPVSISETTSESVANDLKLEKSIAVLPFLDMSPNKDQEYLSDGIAVEILNRLCKFSELKVIGRTSSFSFKTKNEDIKSIGKMLDVANILEGSVRKNGDRIMISIRLTNAENGYTLLSESYSDDLQNIYPLQATIAIDIANKIDSKLADKGNQLLSTKKINPLAYETFLKGKSQFVNGPLNMLPGEIFGAKKYFETAVALDSSFAEAQAYLAITYFNLADWALPREDKLKIGVALDSAQFLVKKSLALDSLNSGVHLAMGSYYFHQYNWIEAEKEKRKAVRLNPGGTEEKFILASFLAQFGQAKEALKLDLEAMKLDPLDFGNKLYYARDLYRARKFDECIRICNLVLQEKPNSSGAYQFLYFCFSATEQFYEASNSLVKYYQLVGDNESANIFKKSYFTSGIKKLIESINNSTPIEFQSPIFMSILYANIEDMDNTFKYINIMYENKLTQISMISQPQFDFLRNDPRYFELYENAGFKAYDEYKLNKK
jgi:TolB-like protein